MNTFKLGVAVILFASPIPWANSEPLDFSSNQVQQSGSVSSGAEKEGGESGSRADKRFNEMLDKMQAAVEEIAQLYGNPVFLQVFTNDVERANELKRRLKVTKSEEDIRREMADLEKKQDELKGDIALKEREAARLASKLVRQRAALDALSTAVEQARKVIEETAK